MRPDYVEAHFNLGCALEAQGNLDAAIPCYRRAAELKPDHAEAHNNLGIALQAQGRMEDAAASHRQALHWKPDYAEAHNNLGNALQAQGRLDDAIPCYRRAVELRPDYAQAYTNLGSAFKDQGKLDDAVACHRRAVQLQPGIAEIHNNLGNAFLAQGNLDDSAACYRRALQLKPDCAEMHTSLGNALHALGKLDDAVACYRRALELKPNYAQALGDLATSLKEQGKLDDAVACYRRAVAMKPDLMQADSNLLFTLHYCPDYDARAIYEESRRWDRRHGEPLAKFIRPHENERSPERRLRIGYVSPDFRSHCQSLFTGPLFSAHDRRNFEIFCYADVACPDDTTVRLHSLADAWRHIVGRRDEEIAQLVRQDEIDILVDLTMHMAHNHALVFARKPAPVQVCWLAYPGTTGQAAIDYRLTDVYLDPPGLHDEDYAEESIRLPDTFWCYDPQSREPAVNPLPALEKGYLTFGCLNNFCKVNPAVLTLWAQVMRAVERSRILILAPEGGHRQDTLALLAREGIQPERVDFIAMQPRRDYLKLYKNIDVGLDTLPYNGHTTSLDSFWMGVPVVTLVGQTVVGRAGLSQLSNLGLPELIAETPEQFVSIAAGLAGDLPRLSQLRATLRERMLGSPLMDAPRFARNIEAAYRGMWQRWCAK